MQASLTRETSIELMEGDLYHSPPIFTPPVKSATDYHDERCAPERSFEKLVGSIPARLTNLVSGIKAKTVHHSGEAHRRHEDIMRPALDGCPASVTRSVVSKPNAPLRTERLPMLPVSECSANVSTSAVENVPS